MENTLQQVYSERFGKVRIISFDGVFYYNGKDAAQCLEYKDTEQAVRVHVQKQDKFTFSPVKITGQIQNLGGIKVAHNAIWINESGLWSLVMHSKMPLAQEFQHWLTSEVIPQIIRTGSYQSEVKPLKNPKAEDFTARERVEMLFKLLNFNLPQALKNKIASQILFELTPNAQDFWENLLAENTAE